MPRHVALDSCAVRALGTEEFSGTTGIMWTPCCVNGARHDEGLEWYLMQCFCLRVWPPFLGPLTCQPNLPEMIILTHSAFCYGHLVLDKNAFHSSTSHERPQGMAAPVCHCDALVHGRDGMLTQQPKKCDVTMVDSGMTTMI
ncbi:hypothetical protein E2C01_002974 [Portunus trituberculatus]|uniref:Uncharacterized protein n=1 Tax=Portunus trituberculatus TaxID=210409 RepID=A0A5B7CMQ8_PORTR|nr:hypothetical protein [Portunus trituberculatus]